MSSSNDTCFLAARSATIILDDVKSHFYLYRCANKRTHRRNSESDKMAKLGGKRNGSKLINGCMKFNTIENLAQKKVLLGSICSFNDQELDICDTNSKSHATFNYMFVSIASSQDIIGIFKKFVFLQFVTISKCQVGSGGLCAKQLACKVINEVNF